MPRGAGPAVTLRPAERPGTTPDMRFVLGLAVGVVLVLAAQLLFLILGGMPAAALDAKPLPLERFLTSRALEAALEKEEKTPAPIAADEPNLLAGAKVYREHCRICHGDPGAPRSPPLGAGMFPRPPRLLTKDEGVTDDPVGETHWVVKHGIRNTGMPSFEGTLSDTAMWRVSLFLQRADQLPPAVQAALR